MIFNVLSTYNEGVRGVFTVSDIAERIKRPDEEIGQAITRVRNWTKEGLIHPVGQANPGTGRAREYSQEALIDAFLIDAFVQCFGSAAVSVPQYLKRIRYFFSDANQRNKLLIIGRTPGRKDFQANSYRPSELAAALRSLGWEMYMVLEIGPLVKRLGLEG
ncbi:hypothetical protein ACVWZV_005260 [Bradyrhizobium sp. GM5.1]